MKWADLLAERLRVLLHLLEDHAHGWVTHNLLHLGIGHCPFLHFLRSVIPRGLADHTALQAFCGLLKMEKTNKEKEN